MFEEQITLFAYYNKLEHPADHNIIDQVCKYDFQMKELEISLLITLTVWDVQKLRRVAVEPGALIPPTFLIILKSRHEQHLRSDI